MAGGRGAWRMLATIVCVVLLVAGGALVYVGFQEQSPEETPTPERDASISASDARRQGRAEARSLIAEWTTREDLGGRRLVIPSLGVNSRVVDEPVVDNAMALPDDLSLVGLLDTTAPLAAAKGSSLVAGHVTYNGQNGVLYPLGNIQPGAAVLTTTDQGKPQAWAVTSVRTFRQESLPAKIFSTRGTRRLTVVTCGGDLIETSDGRWTYERNIVVSAVPLATQGTRPASGRRG